MDGSGKVSSGVEDCRAFLNFWDPCEAWGLEDLDSLSITVKYSTEGSGVCKLGPFIFTSSQLYLLAWPALSGLNKLRLSQLLKGPANPYDN